MGILNRVKKLCTDKGISVGDLEKKLELSNGSIYKWIKTIPGADKVEKVADYFNVTTDYLLGKTAFRNSKELFEHWSGHNDSYFESPFDFGGLLRDAREKQGISVEEVSRALGITESDVEDIENGILPLNEVWAEKYAKFLGTSVSQIFLDNGMDASLNDIPLELLHYYQEQGMSEQEMITAYIKVRAAEYEDAMSDRDRLKEDAKNTAAAFRNHIIKKFPEEFTNADDAREYVGMHSIFGSDGFRPDLMSDEDILDFANEMLRQAKLISYKYKK